MTKSFKIGLIFIIIVLVGLVGFLGFKLYQKNLENTGVLTSVLSPQNAIVTINGKTYKTNNGLLTVKLTPQKYSVVFSYPAHSVVNKLIIIKSREMLDLGKIYLFPVSWSKEELVKDDNVEQFSVDTSRNHLIFFKKTAKNYEWYFYNRNIKETQKFYQTSSLPAQAGLPQEIIFSPDAKKIITRINDNDWRIVFLPKSLIDTEINLNNVFSMG